MSRAFMPWYIGDYLKDTGHLNTEQHGAYLLLLGHCWQHGAIPPSAGERAAITKLSLSRWNKVKAPIERFFNEDGTQKRLSKELEKAEAVSLKRKVFGSRGGAASAIARAKLKADGQPKLKHLVQQSSQQTTEQTGTNKADNHNHIETSSETEAAREPARLGENPAVTALRERIKARSA